MFTSGDRVRYIGAYPPLKDRVGTVLSQFEDGRWLVQFDGEKMTWATTSIIEVEPALAWGLDGSA